MNNNMGSKLDKTDMQLRLGAGYGNLVRILNTLLRDKVINTKNIHGIIKNISCNPYKGEYGTIYINTDNGITREFDPLNLMLEFEYEDTNRNNDR